MAPSSSGALPPIRRASQRRLLSRRKAHRDRTGERSRALVGPASSERHDALPTCRRGAAPRTRAAQPEARRGHERDPVQTDVQLKSRGLLPTIVVSTTGGNMAIDTQRGVALADSLAQTGFRGEIIHPAHPSYEEARKVHNAMIQKQPALIARCVDAADVMKTIEFAQTNAGFHHPAQRNIDFLFADCQN